MVFHKVSIIAYSSSPMLNEHWTFAVGGVGGGAARVFCILEFSFKWNIYSFINITIKKVAEINDSNISLMRLW